MEQRCQKRAFTRELIWATKNAAGGTSKRVVTYCRVSTSDQDVARSLGYVPGRDQDTVAMLDTRSLKIARRAEFFEGSRPWMLPASPDGKEIWVQTASGQNVVLDAETLHNEDLDEQPVTVAFYSTDVTLLSPALPTTGSPYSTRRTGA